MAMIRHRAAAGRDVPTRLLYSSRSYEEIIYREELETVASRDSALEVNHTLTRSRPEGWTGYHRRIDAEMLGEVSWSPDESPLAFVCGPTSTQGATRRNGVQPPAKESAYIRQSCNVWQHPETDDIGSWLRRSRVGAIGPTVRLKLPLILIPL
jgi:NAD(P)H-flavin reductase